VTGYELSPGLVVPLERLSVEPLALAGAADADMLAALAKRLDVLAVKALSGEARIARSGPLVKVAGAVRAELERRCVVSLEPVAETVEDVFETVLTTEPEDGSVEDEIDLDAPEPIDGDAIDVGDLFVQYVALAMDPYPRKPGAAFEREEIRPEDLSPFAALLKRDGAAES